MTREFTTKIIDMLDDGMLDAESTLQNLLNYLSESTVEGFYQSEIGDEEEENDYDEINIVNIKWDTPADQRPALRLRKPECVSISLIDERMTSRDEYDVGEIHAYLADKYGCNAITFDVEVA